jgi:hypothetical protein
MPTPDAPAPNPTATSAFRVSASVSVDASIVYSPDGLQSGVPRTRPVPMPRAGCAASTPRAGGARVRPNGLVLGGSFGVDYLQSALKHPSYTSPDGLQRRGHGSDPHLCPALDALASAQRPSPRRVFRRLTTSVSVEASIVYISRRPPAAWSRIRPTSMPALDALASARRPQASAGLSAFDCLSQR